MSRIKDGGRYSYAWRRKHFPKLEFPSHLAGKAGSPSAWYSLMLCLCSEGPLTGTLRTEPIPLYQRLQQLDVHVEDFQLVSPPKALNLVWNTIVSSDLFNHHKHLMYNHSSHFFFSWGMGHREVKEIVQSHTACKGWGQI